METVREARIDQNPSVDPPISKPSCCIRLCKKICSVVSAIFEFIRNVICCFRRSNTLELTSAERKLATTLVKYYRETPHRPRCVRRMSEKAPLVSSRGSILESIAASAKPSAQILEEEKKQLSSRDLIVKQLKGFGIVLSEVIHDNIFVPLIKSVQSRAKTDLKTLKLLSAFILVPLLGKGVEYLMDEIEKYQEEGSVNLNFQNDLKGLLRNKDFEEIRKAMDGIVPSQDPHASERLKRCVHITLEWLYEFQNSRKYIVPLNKLYQEQSFYPNEIETSQEMLFSYLINTQIETFIDLIANTLGDQFPKMVHQMVQDNTGIITEILAHRAVDVFENLKFTNLVDDATKIAIQHIQSYVIAEKKAKALFAKAVSASEKEEKLNEETAVELGWILKEIGKAKADKEQCELRLDNLQNRIILIEFAEQPGCHEKVKQAIEAAKMRDEEFGHLQKDLMQQQFFRGLARKIVSFMLPDMHFSDAFSKDRFGEKEKKEASNAYKEHVHALTYLIQNIKLSDEIKALFAHLLQLGEDILISPIKSYFQNASSLYPVLVEAAVHGKLKRPLLNLISQGLTHQFNMLTDPVRLNDLVIKTIMPSLRQLMLSNFAQQVMSNSLREASEKNPGELAQLFFELVSMDESMGKDKDKASKEAGDNQDYFSEQLDTFELKREKIIHEITAFIFKLTSSVCSSYPLKDEADRQFPLLIRPVIEQIELVLLKMKKDFPGIQQEKVLVVLRMYFDVSGKYNTEELDLYSQLLPNVMELAEYECFLGIAKYMSQTDFIQPRLTNGILNAMQKVRSTYEHVTINSFDAIIRNFGTHSALEHLFGWDISTKKADEEAELKEHAESSQIEKEAKLKVIRSPQVQLQSARKAAFEREVSLFAKLTHDMFSLNAGGIVIKKGLQVFGVGTDEKYLAGMIKKVYGKIVNNPMLIANLILLIQEKAFTALLEAAKNVKATPRTLRSEVQPTRLNFANA